MTTLTAAEFIAQGTTPGAILSIAEANAANRGRLRAIAKEVALATGKPLQIPGRVTEERAAARMSRMYRRAA